MGAENLIPKPANLQNAGRGKQSWTPALQSLQTVNRGNAKLLFHSDLTSIVRAKDSMANPVKHEALALRHAVPFFLLFAQFSSADQLKARNGGRR